jgi:hypothetical protein
MGRSAIEEEGVFGSNIIKNAIEIEDRVAPNEFSWDV